MTFNITFAQQRKDDIQLLALMNLPNTDFNSPLIRIFIHVFTLVIFFFTYSDFKCNISNTMFPLLTV